jgi:hypothetical protein
VNAAGDWFEIIDKAPYDRPIGVVGRKEPNLRAFPTSVGRREFTLFRGTFRPTCFFARFPALQRFVCSKPNQSAIAPFAGARLAYASAAVARKQYTPISNEQARWLRSWAGDQARVLHRVMRGLHRLGHDVASPVCRRTYDAEVAICCLADERDANTVPGAIWTAGPWRGESPALSQEQRDYLKGVAVEALRCLRQVTEYFDRAGCPSRSLGRSVRASVDRLHELTVHLHYLNCPDWTGGSPEAERPIDPTIDCGSGI